MLLKLYSFLATTFKPFLKVHLHQRLKKGKEFKGRLAERYGKPSRKRPVGPLIWIHVASLGEAQSTVPLINYLQKFYSHLHILLTYGTVTAARVMEQRFNDKVIQQFIPLDVPKWVRRFLDYWKPSLGIWVESELWPNLMKEAQKRDIDIIRLNARISSRSFKRWQKVPQLSQRLFRGFSLSLAQTPEMAERYQKLGAQNVFTTGNFKAASDPLPVFEETLEALKTNVGNRPCWLAASTHPGEEEVIMEAHKLLKQIFPDLLTLIAPRHIHRRIDIQKIFQIHHYQCAIRSQGDNITPKTDFYLIDSMGELGTFFKLSPITFVAGSLLLGSKALGGHNPLEPALLNCAISFGPDMSNGRDSADGLLKRNAAVEVTNAQEIAVFVQNCLQQPHMAQEMAEKARLYAEAQKEVLHRVMDHLSPYLEKLSDVQASQAKNA